MVWIKKLTQMTIPLILIVIFNACDMQQSEPTPEATDLPNSYSPAPDLAIDPYLKDYVTMSVIASSKLWRTVTLTIYNSSDVELFTGAAYFSLDIYLDNLWMNIPPLAEFPLPGLTVPSHSYVTLARDFHYFPPMQSGRYRIRKSASEANWDSMSIIQNTIRHHDLVAEFDWLLE